MSGLTGIIPLRLLSHGYSELETMVRCLVDKPFHVSGRWGAEEAALPQVGWVADSKHASVAFPLWNERRDAVLLMQGELVGLDELAAALPLRDRSSQFGGDPRECLLQAYEEYDLGFLSRLNGRFSGLLIDRRQDKAILFNDRYGLNRIYWHQRADAFRFSSAARSLLAILPECRRLDERGLAEFFTVGCVLQNRSLYSGIDLLPPASAWIFHRDGRIEKKRYFDPSTLEEQPLLNAEDYTRRLIEVFGRVAPRYSSGPEPMGMSITGGLDSRMLLAWTRAAAGTLPCYTFGGPYRECADVRLGRRLAKVAGQPFRMLRVESDFFRDFPALAEKCVTVSDGAMDVSGAIEVYMNRQARQIAPIRLTGNYGSEILRRNVAFRPGRTDRTLFTPEFARWLDAAAETYRSEAAGHKLSFIAFKQVPWHHYARFSAEQSQLTPRSPFLDNDLVALAFQAPPELATSPQPLLELIARGNPALESVPTDRGHRRGALGPRDRLTRSWQEFTSKAEYAWDYGMPDRLARVERFTRPLHLERLFLGRHKFYHFRIWYRDQLAPFVGEILQDSRAVARSYLRPDAVKSTVADHLGGTRNRTVEIHKLLSFELLHRTCLASVEPDRCTEQPVSFRK